MCAVFAYHSNCAKSASRVIYVKKGDLGFPNKIERESEPERTSKRDKDFFFITLDEMTDACETL